MNNTRGQIYIVDDDASVCRSLERLFRSGNYQVASFLSAQEFFDLGAYESPCCLILDVTMPDMNGLEVQQKLVSLAIIMPIIFITGNATIPMSVHVIKAGAVNFLEKPFDPGELVAEVEKAVQLSMQQSNEKNEMSAITQHIDSLTPRENEVFKLVITGKMNKQIAAELGVCEKTIKVHRARVMEKMNVKSLAELVHLSDSISATQINN